MQFRRIFLVVMDSFGIGAASDAAAFGDVGTNTLRAVAASPFFAAETLSRLGLAALSDGVLPATTPCGIFARLAKVGAGKDTVTGHWELAGVKSTQEMPVYKNGFPKELLDAFVAKTGRGVLCNLPYSGTDVIRDFGKESVETGKFIVYTSADSVFQIAAHEDVIPLDELYRACEIARALCTGKHAVGRVIARPFTGTHPYTRTANRHDYALPPPRETLLDAMTSAGLDTIGVGKISDIFAGRGIGVSHRTRDNAHGMQTLAHIAAHEDFCGLCFVNLVDFDAKYGHRNDRDGYASAVAAFDAFLADFLPTLGRNDLLFVTADHGCDPSSPGTDHTREDVPLLGYTKHGAPTALGMRQFADLGASIADLFGLAFRGDGTSFAAQIRKETL